MSDDEDRTWWNEARATKPLGDVLTKEELIAAGAKILPEVAGLSDEELGHWLTVFTYLGDRCLAELEHRDVVERGPDGVAIVPYNCEYMVETSLTRQVEH